MLNKVRNDYLATNLLNNRNENIKTMSIDSCFKWKNAEDAKEFLEKYINERGRDKPRLPSLGETERLNGTLNG
jgi:hypothetical protein